MISDQIIENFFNANKDILTEELSFPQFKSDLEKYHWLIQDSKVPYWEVKLPNLPYHEMLSEARQISDMFVEHRSNDPTQHGAAHKGWSSLTIHGISSQHTMNWDSYPEYKQLNNESLVPYTWTEIANLIPRTVEYFKDIFPHEYYTRVRFMKLAPGGYILPHKDRDHTLLFPINIALNNPDGCNFIMENYGIIPFEESKSFLLDLSNRHAVWNNSNEDRIHIIVHWRAPLYHFPKGKEWVDIVLGNKHDLNY